MSAENPSKFEGFQLEESKQLGEHVLSHYVSEDRARRFLFLSVEPNSTSGDYFAGDQWGHAAEMGDLIRYVYTKIGSLDDFRRISESTREECSRVLLSGETH